MSSTEPQTGDHVTFFGTDGEVYDAVVTNVWDSDTVDLVHAAGEGDLQESTSVPRGDEYYAFKPGWNE